MSSISGKKDIHLMGQSFPIHPLKVKLHFEKDEYKSSFKHKQKHNKKIATISWYVTNYSFK